MKKLNKAFKQLTIFAFVMLGGFSANAQYSLLKSADQQFQAFNFVKAIELYTQAYDKKQDLKTAERLGESYYNMRNYIQAEVWYAKAAQAEKAKPENILKYAEVLKNNGRFREAKAQYQRYEQVNPAYSQELLKKLYASCDSAMKWIENPLKHVEINNEQRLNSPQSDFGATGGPLGITFVSDRFNGKVKPNDIYGWTGNPFLSMYAYSNNTLNEVAVKGMNDNHIGPATYTPDGKEMIFSITRSPKKSEMKKVSKQMTVNIEIFTAKAGDPDWITNAKPFRYNNIAEWSVGDPFLSASGDTLYFASDMTGGFGGTDIYYVTRLADGSWSEAVNMGATVNTLGEERFPVKDKNGTFYFSSDGHLGMGGLDIFKVVGNKVVNLNYPLNSSQDDFSLRFTKDLKGYVSSNRPGGLGADDIYTFDLDKQIQISLEGGVFNAKTRLPVSGAQVMLVSNGDKNNQISIHADQDGKYRFNLKEGNQYEVTAEQVGFKAPVTIAFNTKNIDSSMAIVKDIYLEPVEVKEIVVIKNIYFDFDKSNIRPDAAIELDKVLSFLKSAPTAKIELSAHTDSRGTAEYNTKLSQRRADSSIEYLVSKGIDRSRLIAKGYGFSRMVNDCGKGKNCTEEEHAQNRRVEFVILEQ